MNFLNDINGTVNDITRKTKEKVEAAKIAGEIRALKADMNKAYTEYGKACFGEKIGQDGMPSDAFFETLLSYKARLGKLNERLDTLRSIRRCPACGTPQEDEAVFCNRCGARMPKKDTATVEINPVKTSNDEPITPTEEPEASEEPDTRNYEDE